MQCNGSARYARNGTQLGLHLQIDNTRAPRIRLALCRERLTRNIDSNAVAYTSLASTTNFGISFKASILIIQLGTRSGSSLSVKSALKMKATMTCTPIKKYMIVFVLPMKELALCVQSRTPTSRYVALSLIHISEPTRPY